MSKFVLDISSANPKQIQFFKAHQRFVAYGGARGGGKSWALRKKAIMLAINYPGIRMLLLRRTYADLQENHVLPLQAELNGFAKYSDKRKTFEFQNGSALKLGYCASEGDVLQYQGQEYDIIFIDEATQFTEFQYQNLIPCMRGVNGFPKRMYLTCNPGNVGHQWVKRLFITKKYKNNENPDEYLFIPATVYDNTVLMQSDPEYVHMLDNLDEKLRQAWRDGNWDLLAGQYFSEFDRNIHVCKPFTIPEHWKKYRAIDYGLDCLACLWIAIGEGGSYYVYREYSYPNKIVSEGARDIINMSAGEEILYTAAPTDMWQRSQESAKTKASLFAESGLNLVKASRDREAGWLAVKNLLKPIVYDGKNTARLQIFDTCKELIECLPALQIDEKHPTDCMTEPHNITHLPDALRYFSLQHTTPAAEPTEEKSVLQKYKERVLGKKTFRKRGWY